MADSGDDGSLPGDSAGDAGDDFGEGGEQPDVFEPVRYERSGTDVLPWQSVAVDIGTANFTEAGFMSLEEIPAGSYDIVKLPNGGTVIKLRNKAAQQAAQAAASGAAPPAPPAAEKLRPSKAERKAAAAAAAAAIARGDAAPARPSKAERKAAAAAAAAAVPAAAAAASATVATAATTATTTTTKKRKRIEDQADQAEAAGSTSGWSGVKAAAAPPPPPCKHAPHARVAPSQRAPLALEDVAHEWGVFNLHPALLGAIARLGFAAPTPIQRRALPAALTAYKDVIGAAETGSGKTLAYGLPLLQRLLERRERLGMDAPAAAPLAATAQQPPPPPRRGGAFRYLPALVLTPTRELAMQVADHLSALCEGTPLRVVAIVGGLSSEKQARLLRARPDVVVATPGRLWDLASHGAAAASSSSSSSSSSASGSGKTGSGAGAEGAEFLSGLGGLQFLVLDEADRLAEKGHYDALNAILAATQAPPPPPAGGAPDALFDGLFAGNIDDALDPVAERILRDKALRARAAATAAAAAAARAAAPAAKPAATGSEEEEEDEGEDEGEGGEHEGDEGEDAEGARGVAAAAPRPPPAAAAAAAAAGGFTLFDAPSHYRRQTFLYSATLGLSTAQSAKDAASALLAAKASQHAAAAAVANAASGGTGAGVPAKLGKKAMRKALAAARALTPVEALMARVGLLGKPAVITVGAAAAGSGGGGEDEEGAEAGGGNGDGDGDGDGDGGTRAAVRSALPATSVALPPGLRLARLTCGPGSKDARLYHFLLRFPGRSLVFVNSIGALKRVAALLGALRLPLHTLHASMQQRQRLKHLDAFRADPHRGVLVCTDVAARGLDIPAVGLVLHYSLPPSAEVFVHRCGRTARALSAGLAVALVSAEDQRAYSRILSVLGLAGVGLPEFPLDDGPYERRLGSRVALARRLCESQSAANKLSSSQHRLLTMAAEAGLELDDATAAEEGLGGGGGEWPPAGRAGAKKKQRRQQASEEDEEGGGGDGEGGGGGGGGRRAGEAEEDRADAAWRAKMQARATSSLRRELDALLAQPLAPAGMSRRYVAAVNPLLVTGAVAPGGGGGGGGGGRAGKAAALTASRASHPLHGRVSVAQQPEEAHGNGADEGEEEEEGEELDEAGGTAPLATRAPQPAPRPAVVARSGSALVAPRVHVAQLDIDATRGGGGGGGGSGGGHPAAGGGSFGGIIPVHRLQHAAAAEGGRSGGGEAMAMLAAQGRKTTLGVPLLAKAMLAKQQARKKADKRAPAPGARGHAAGGGHRGGAGGGAGRGGRGRGGMRKGSRR